MFELLIRNILGRGGRVRSDKKRALRHYEEAEHARAISKLDEVEKHYRSAIKFDPQAVALVYNLGLLLQQLGEVEAAEEALIRAIELQPGFQSAQSSFLCLGDFAMHLSRGEIYRRHVNWAERFSDPLSAAAKRHEIPTETGRIKVGYVSADFCQHVTARFIEPVLRLHDKSRFDVFCYSNLATPYDEMTRHLKALSGHWRDVSAITDEELATMVRSDKIDILIDLSGHSLGNRLLMFARKPAPIQITWLGYLNTTGMAAMQYRLTDAISDPPGSDQWYREKLLRMPQPQWCYVPEAGPVRAPVSVPSERSKEPFVTFVCGTRFMKVNSAAVRLWSEILSKVPGSKLRMIDIPDHARRASLARHFADAGLASRVEFLPTLRAEDYWKFLGEADIALDTFPYTGATTSCDCLWMGVPVVTLAGICGAARSASSLLSALGLSELIANSTEEYVAIAVALGLDRSKLSELRRTLRPRMLDSAICNPILFTKALEQQYEAVWALWREGIGTSE